MHMLDPKTRRKRIFKRALLYIIMTSAVIGLVVLGMFTVLGFTVDEKTGTAQQGGLIQFRSFPDGANVTLNNQKLATKTPTKSNAKVADYDVAIKKPLYRQWRKKTDIRQGELLWLNALLVPTTLSTTEIMSFSELAQAVPSPDKKWLVVLEKNTQPSVKLIDLRDEKKPVQRVFSVPASFFLNPKPTDIYEVTEWDFGARYMLLKRINEGQTQWYRLDRTNPQNVINLSQIAGIPMSDVRFTGTSGNAFYALSEASIRLINSSQKTVSDPIGSNITQFILYKENIVSYLEKTAVTQKAIYKKGNDKPLTIATSSDMTQPLVIAQSEYFNDTYIGVVRGVNLEIIQNPESRKNVYFKTRLPFTPQWLYWSNNGQFLVAQAGNQLFTYNLERKQSFRFDMPNSELAYSRLLHSQWLDDFRLWNDNGGKLTMFDFDGTNPQPLSTVTPGYGVTLSSNGERLFTISINETTKKPVLQSSVMVLEP